MCYDDEKGGRNNTIVKSVNDLYLVSQLSILIDKKRLHTILIV